MTDFEPLFCQAKALLEADPSAEQAVAVQTAGGVRSFANHAVTSGDTSDETAFVRSLAESGDTKVVRIVCLWQSGLTVDLPSWSLRAALLELDPTNRDAEILLRTADGCTTRTIEASM